MHAVTAVFLSIALAGPCCLRAQETRVAVAAGAGHNALLKADGTVWTWGNNAYGQLGRETTDSWGPAPVPGLSGVQSIATGDEFTMALKADGTVWTWGRNEDGELGIGSKQDGPRPAAVSGLPRIIAIAAAGNHALALDSKGIAWSWGAVPNRTSVLAPLQVPGLTHVIAIAAGDHHNIALDDTGQVWVWGDHGAGDLGDHCYNCSYYPQRLPGLSDVTALAGGYQTTVALKKDGTVWVIGYGTAGQLGNGTNENFALKPVMVSGLSGMRSISARYMNVFALKADGTVWGWGSNHFNQLGNPVVDSENSNKPVRAGTLTGIVAIAAGPSHAVALNAQGALWTWGQNDRGALGADPESLHGSDVPMRPGQAIPPDCNALFACVTAKGKVIRVCGEQDPGDLNKWTKIHYRFGPESGPPELMYPADPDSAPPSLFFSKSGPSVRFTNGSYTYRVDLAGGVEVKDAKGKIISKIPCAERPQVYIDYLKENLPAEPK